MSETLAIDEVPARRGRGRLALIALVLSAGICGFAASYMGFVSPLAMFSKDAGHSEPLPEIGFVDVPRIVVPMPGRNRQLMMSIKLEVAPQDAAQVQLLMPRIADSFTGFLSDIDPAAMDRRGVLEIIRAELTTRAQIVLGDGIVKEVLITEFAIQ
ncbi:flagellar basal body protein FliL [Paracoccus aurantiacus]|uniref:Flagellar protein FliL n=1 Tax=Paracoccus aurantiacus TaxID=2599412 RepID=A0A5C6S0X7_9RHOB|nr:flagellar basal body-associated FliL family protein [Paracoccus aurantiacus]TXB68054.1 flagellar basal body protein FliL [Paracoccus aurantiacus]